MPSKSIPENISPAPSPEAVYKIAPVRKSGFAKNEHGEQKCINTSINRAKPTDQTVRRKRQLNITPADERRKKLNTIINISGEITAGLILPRSPKKIIWPKIKTKYGIAGKIETAILLKTICLSVNGAVIKISHVLASLSDVMLDAEIVTVRHIPTSINTHTNPTCDMTSSKRPA